MRIGTKFEFQIGDYVYLKLDEDSQKGMITGILMRSTGNIYYVSWGDREETTHYPLELTTEKDFGIGVDA